MPSPLHISRLAAALCATALATAMPALQAQTTTTAPAATGTATTQARSGASAPGTAQGTRVSRQDRKFVEEAASDGMAEVRLGQLAQERAASTEVKQYGEQMVNDHGKANDELKALAAARGITLPDKPGSGQRRMHDGLAKLRSAEFDRMYMAHMTGDHRKAVSLFEKQAKSGDDAELKAFAQKTLPTLQDHLKKAQAVHDTIKQAPKR